MTESRAASALCIHDLSGVGRCSLSVILPVMSVCGVQACALPTALLSTHTGGLGTPARTDEFSFACAALEHYETLRLSFDCVYSGYLAAPQCAALVRRAHTVFPKAWKVVDPVLGDGGKLYRFVTGELMEAMRGLCLSANVITPNVTESAVLLGLAPCDDAMTQQQAKERMQALRGEFGCDVVLTGIRLENGARANGLLWGTREPQVYLYRETGGHCPGSGDLFTAAFTALVLGGNDAPFAVRHAAEFVRRAVASVEKADGDPRFGAWFERHLPFLMTSRGKLPRV